VPGPATLALFALASITLIAIPGPNALYIAARSLSQGRAAGVASALGVEAGTLVHVVAAVAGLSALVASSDLAFDAIRYLGVAYLLFLGIRTIGARVQWGGDAARRRERLTGAIYLTLAALAAVAGGR
jgi:threonine/homoserine/homoserine lactone efflux protein